MSPRGWWLWAATLAACGGEAVEPSVVVDLGPPPDAVVVGDMRPDIPPAARVWFVDARAGDAGDGSRESPFSTPAAAYAMARSGDIVLLLPGEHPTPPLPPPDVELIGSGAEVTTVAGPLAVDRPVVMGAMTVRGGAPPLHVTSTGRATVDALTLTGADGVAIRVEGTLEGRDVRATGSPALVVEAAAGVELRAGALDGIGGAAVVSRGRLRLDTVGVSAAAEGVRLEAGEAVLETALVDGVTVGLEVVDGQAVVRGGVVRRAIDDRGTGTGVRVSGGSAEVEGLTISHSDRGFRVDPQGALTVRESLVEAPATDGLSVQGGEAVVETLLVTDPRNVGAAVLDGGRLEAEALEVTRPGRVGVLVDGAELVARGLVVHQPAVRGVTVTRATAVVDGLIVDGAGDVGVQITDPADAVEITNGRVEGCATTGVAIFGGPGRVRLRDTVVRGTLRGTGGLAEGVHVFQGLADLEGVISAENAGAGALFEQSSGSITGGALSSNGEPGVVVLEPSEPVTAREVVLRGNGGAGALALAGELRVIDAVATETTASPLVGPGHGLQAAIAGRLVVEGGVASRNAGSGVAFDPATAGSVSAVELRENEGYGLQVGCGADVAEVAAPTFVDNALGDRSLCER